MDNYSSCIFINGLALFVAFLLAFKENPRHTTCAAILWIISIISIGGYCYSYSLLNGKILALLALSGAASVLLFPWVSRRVAMPLAKILFLVITPPLLLLLSAPTLGSSYQFPLGASYVGYTMLWFRIRENFDAEKLTPNTIVTVQNKLRMVRVIGWTAYCMIAVFLFFLAAPDRISREVFPFMFHARPTSSMNACINNLRQLDAAANQFALEHNLKAGDPIKFPDDLTPYIKLTSKGEIPPCPAGGIYHISKVGEPPTCSLGSSVTPSHVLP